MFPSRTSHKTSTEYYDDLTRSWYVKVNFAFLYRTYLGSWHLIPQPDGPRPPPQSIIELAQLRLPGWPIQMEQVFFLDPLPRPGTSSRLQSIVNQSPREQSSLRFKSVSYISPNSFPRDSFPRDIFPFPVYSGPVFETIRSTSPTSCGDTYVPQRASSELSVLHSIARSGALDSPRNPEPQSIPDF